ncbi:hypothetical protein PTB13_12645, partial [Bacillus sp. MHSD17]|nr:hypothetical protein [Bacillus sp. MHSD17]
LLGSQNDMATIRLSYDAKMNSYAIAFETNKDGEFTIEYKSPNNFNISPEVQAYLSKHSKFTE